MDANISRTCEITTSISTGKLLKGGSCNIAEL
jgi:hypothetical protein